MLMGHVLEVDMRSVGRQFSTPFFQDCWGCSELLLYGPRLLKKRKAGKSVLKQVLQLIVCWLEEKP